MSEHPEASVWQVKQVLAQSADKVGSFAYGADPTAYCCDLHPGRPYGYGRISVQRALLRRLFRHRRATSAAAAARPPPPPASIRDTKAPVVHVYATSGRHRKAIAMRHRVQDNGGKNLGAALRLPEDAAAEDVHAGRCARPTTRSPTGSSSASPGRHLPVLRPRERRRGQPLARLRGDPHSVRGHPAGAASEARELSYLTVADGADLVDAPFGVVLRVRQ